MKTPNDLKVMLSQWRTQFPNLYLRAVRGDCSVTVMTKANPLTVEDLNYIEKTYMPSPEVLEASDAAFVASVQYEAQFDEEALTSHMANFLADFAELAEEAGMDDVAEELNAATEEAKPKKERKERKTRKGRNHPDNFPL